MPDRKTYFSDKICKLEKELNKFLCAGRHSNVEMSRSTSLHVQYHGVQKVLESFSLKGKGIGKEDEMRD